MPFSDYPPDIIVPRCPEGHAELIAMVNEEPILQGLVYECGEFARTQYPIYTDDDYYRPKHMPVCANRDRSGVRDMNWCCRCMSGLPATFAEKERETFRDAAINV